MLAWKENGSEQWFSSDDTLGDMGVKYASVVVQKIANPKLEPPPTVAGFPKEYLIENPRPVLMKDFFDEELVRIIHRNPGWND